MVASDDDSERLRMEENKEEEGGVKDWNQEGRAPPLDVFYIV